MYCYSTLHSIVNYMDTSFLNNLIDGSSRICFIIWELKVHMTSLLNETLNDRSTKLIFFYLL
jgi:hypothetical protein